VIVKCAYCGPLPLADLEELGPRAWGKHVVQVHPEWPIAMVVPMDSLWFPIALIDGRLDA
jgi:hypothetical protein